MARDGHIGGCDLCGEPIYIGEDYYKFPDGFTVCNSEDCIGQWVKGYKECQSFAALDFPERGDDG